MFVQQWSKRTELLNIIIFVILALGEANRISGWKSQRDSVGILTRQKIQQMSFMRHRYLLPPPILPAFPPTHRSPSVHQLITFSHVHEDSDLTVRPTHLVTIDILLSSVHDFRVLCLLCET